MSDQAEKTLRVRAALNDPGAMVGLAAWQRSDAGVRKRIGSGSATRPRQPTRPGWPGLGVLLAHDRDLRGPKNGSGEPSKPRTRLRS